MVKYSLNALERHWVSIEQSFDDSYIDCIAVFREIFQCASTVSSVRTGKKSLEQNCAFILIAKVMNHASATLVLLKRGLIIDAVLTCRNAMETSMLIELLAKQPSLCEKWSYGEQFRPSRVRKRLAELSSVPVGDLIIEVTADEYDEARFAYDWMSRISHANVESIRHAAKQKGENDFELKIGGGLSRPEIVAVTIVLGTSCLRAFVTCAAVHAPNLLDQKVFDEFQKQLNSVRVKTNAQPNWK
ncbi:MAG: hypothetical protein PHI97_30155 [Desulfobulbus sp.]|nr:hypothetical protein [Desulfobulbus sp.]